MAWLAKSVGMGKVLNENTENDPASLEFAITANGALTHVIDITIQDAVITTGITAKLQTKNGEVWQDSKAVAITGNGTFYIKLNSKNEEDQQYLPLLQVGRIVISTGEGDSGVIASVHSLQDR